MPATDDPTRASTGASPAQIRDWLTGGVVQHRAGQLAAARAAYERVLAADSSHFDALHLLGVVVLACGEYQQAIELLTRAVRRQPGHAAAHQHLASALYAAGRHSQAIPHFERAIALRPDYVQALVNLGTTYSALGLYAQARDWLDRALRIEPRNAEALLQCAGALRALGEFERSLASYDALLALDGGRSAAHRGRALTLQELGRSAEAHAALGHALASGPAGADEWSHLAGALCAMGRPVEAVAASDHALALAPGHAQALAHKGNALRSLHRPADALRVAQEALSGGATPGAHVGAAAALLDLGEAARALAHCDAALALQPDNAAAHTNRGAALRLLGRSAEAVESFATGARLSPTSKEAWRNLIALLRERGQAELALTRLDEAIGLAPALADLHTDRAELLLELGRPALALAGADQALAHDPCNVAALLARAAALCALRRPGEAMPALDRALGLAPQACRVHHARACALLDDDRPVEALAASEEALARVPAEHAAPGAVTGAGPRADDDAASAVDRAAAHCTRGLALLALGRTDEALAAWAQTMHWQPGAAPGYVNAGLCHLLLGRFEVGWPLYEWRARPGGIRPPYRLAQPVWRGEPLPSGCRLALCWEQGLGDTIQFARYASVLAARGIDVVLVVQERLVRLLRGLAPPVRVEPDTADLSDCDWQCSLLSLPAVLGTSLATLPVAERYLGVPDELRSTWRARIGANDFRIGICWQGSTTVADVGRSFPLALFDAISRIEGVRLISLQHGDGVEQLASMPAGMRVEVPVVKLDAGPDAFIDTAAVMEDLDLVITSDTAIAHLAGALGRPTWVALKHVPDWRWLLDRRDSPWYPRHRLYRQRCRGDWAGVFAELHADLRELLSRR